MEDLETSVKKVVEATLSTAADPNREEEKTKIISSPIKESLHAEFKAIAKAYNLNIAALLTLLIEQTVSQFNAELDPKDEPVLGEILLPGGPKECTLKFPEEEATGEAEETAVEPELTGEAVAVEEEEPAATPPVVNRFPSFNDWSSLLKVPKIDD